MDVCFTQRPNFFSLTNDLWHTLRPGPCQEPRVFSGPVPLQVCSALGSGWAISSRLMEARDSGLHSPHICLVCLAGLLSVCFFLFVLSALFSALLWSDLLCSAFKTPPLFDTKGAARYAGLLLAPTEDFGLRPRPFFALRAKKDLFMSVFAKILVIFGDQ